MLRIVGLAVLCALLSSGVVPDGPQARSSGLRPLRFSPNGQYILAQDDSTITVLTVQPLHTLFRVSTSNTLPAQFTPDSRQLVFIGSGVQKDPTVPAPGSHWVERWNIADHHRIASNSIAWQPCGTERLSPNGTVLVCVSSNGTLSLLDVSSGETLLVKKGFGSTSTVVSWHAIVDPANPPDSFHVLRTPLNPSSALIDFSPDGRFLVAFPSDLNLPVAWDLLQKEKISLKGRLRDLRYVYFAFLAPDRVVISEPSAPSNTLMATVWAFPSGELLSKFKVPPGRLLPATNPDFVIVRPFTPPFEKMPPYGALTPEGSPPVGTAGAIDVRNGQAIVSDGPALDVFGSTYVTAQPNGDVGLYERGKGLQATVSLKAD